MGLGEGDPEFAGLAVELASSAGDGERGRLGWPDLKWTAPCTVRLPPLTATETMQFAIVCSAFFSGILVIVQTPESNPTIG